ncbi:MAG: DUF790 family protein [Candidatus Heimdallarchaeota archaeon]|nr:DUF790 family protein [Candidatus Heimdallarchaeota archaeon]
MFSLSIFPHRSYKVKGRFERKLTPLFLTEKELCSVPKILNLYQKGVKEEWTRKDLEKKTKKYKSSFPGRKFSALLRTLNDFFEFREQSLDELLPAESYSKLIAKGIHSVFTLNLFLYDLLAHDYSGYIPLAKRSVFLAETARELALPSKGVLESIITLNLDENQLVRLKSHFPSVKDIELSFIRHALETILNNSVKLTIVKRNTTGAFVKDGIRYCKKYLLDFDVYFIDEKEAKNNASQKDEKNAVAMEIGGPKEVGGSAGDYSWHLTQFMNVIIQRYPDLSVEAIVKIRNKRCFYQFCKKDLMVLQKSSGKESKSFVNSQAIDSRVEARFQRYFSMNELGWELLAEPRPLIFEDESGKRQIMIPDFIIKRGLNEEYLLEIIGYYRESYINRKIRKLEALKATRKEPIILLIDDKIASHFKILEDDYPIFTYGLRRPFPISRILHFLEENVSSFEARFQLIKEEKERFHQKLTNCLNEKHFCLLKELCQLLNLHSEDELLVVMKDKEIQAQYQEQNLSWISGLGIITNDKLANIKHQILSYVDERGLPLSVLLKKIDLEPELAKKITRLLEEISEIEVLWNTLTPLIKLKQ